MNDINLSIQNILFNISMIVDWASKLVGTLISLFFKSSWEKMKKTISYSWIFFLKKIWCLKKVREKIYLSQDEDFLLSASK